MEKEKSKPPIIKLAIMAAILVIALLFKGQIKDGIASLRDRSKQSGDRIQTKKLSSSSHLKMSRQIIKELEKISTEEKERPLLDNEYYENITRDIFTFQKKPLPKKLSINKKVKNKKKKKQKKGHSIKLEATITGDEPLAVINNQPLLLGQNIFGYKLKKIEEGVVTLSGKGKEIILKLGREKKWIQ